MLCIIQVEMNLLFQTLNKKKKNWVKILEI